MERIGLFIVAGSIALGSAAQNLVPNGSFEEYGECPDLSDQLVGNVVGWYKCPGTPDYFNECAAGTSYGVPLNIFDYQWASHGSGYAGVVTYVVGVPHGREIIYTQLESPLTVGVPTYLSIKVAPGGQGNYPVPVGWTSKGIGLRFTMQPFEWFLETPFPNDAQLYANEVLIDTAEWAIMSIVYVPDSAYQYLAVGNFFEDSLSSVTVIDSSGFDFAYVYMDEVCVSLTPNACDFDTGVQRRRSGSIWQAASPFSERLMVRFELPLEQPVQLDLFDEQGRRCASRTVGIGHATVDWDNVTLKDGLYIMVAQSKYVAYRPIRVLKLSPN